MHVERATVVSDSLEKTIAEPSMVQGELEHQSRSWLKISYSRWVWLMASLAVALRLQQYLYNRSLWLDEALMAYNLLRRSYGQLTQHLDYQLVAPFAWLFATKSSSLLFGNNELSLRLPVFVAATLGVVAVCFLAKRLLPVRAAAIAVGLFALSPALIYYSSELKPYGSDVGAAALLWLLGFWTVDGRLTWRKLTLLAVYGAAVLWFSHPCLFVAVAFGLTIVWMSLAERDARRFGKFLPVFAAWGASFAVNYWIALRMSSHNTALAHAYPFLTRPLGLMKLEEVLQSIFGLQQNFVTVLLGATIFAFVIGCLHFWRYDRFALSFLLLPLLIALGASSQYLYPLVGRFYMFFTPALVILVAAGAEELLNAARARQIPIGATVVVLLFFHPICSTADVVTHHMRVEELRPVLKYVQQHQQPGDVSYVYSYGKPAYLYYAQVYGLGSSNLVLGGRFRGRQPGVKNWDVYEQDFSKLQGPRVWAIFTHAWAGDGVDERVYALHVLDSMGKRIDFCEKYGASAYLYDLRPVAAVPVAAVPK